MSGVDVGRERVELYAQEARAVGRAHFADLLLALRAAAPEDTRDG